MYSVQYCSLEPTSTHIGQILGLNCVNFNNHPQNGGQGTSDEPTLRKAYACSLHALFCIKPHIYAEHGLLKFSRLSGRSKSIPVLSIYQSSTINLLLFIPLSLS